MTSLVGRRLLQRTLPLARLATPALSRCTPVAPVGCSEGIGESRKRAACNNSDPAPVWGLTLHRWMTTAVPTEQNVDPLVQNALDRLMSNSWIHLEEDVRVTAESALAKGAPGSERLRDAYSAAIAIERFSESLLQLRLDMDDKQGGKFAGGNSMKLPDHFKTALDSALERYQKYMASFTPEEGWLLKKVENELGTVLLQLRQRCAGLSPDWNNLALIGTTGLHGSYIERRTGVVKH